LARRLGVGQEERFEKPPVKINFLGCKKTALPSTEKSDRGKRVTAYSWSFYPMGGLLCRGEGRPGSGGGPEGGRDHPFKKMNQKPWGKPINLATIGGTEKNQLVELVLGASRAAGAFRAGHESISVQPDRPFGPRVANGVGGRGSHAVEPAWGGERGSGPSGPRILSLRVGGVGGAATRVFSDEEGTDRDIGSD